jgi:hypothetical protein
MIPMSRFAQLCPFLLILACASTTPRSSSGAPRSSICAGYEEILALADRPLTPCEVDTQLRPARSLPSPWVAANNGGPCQFVDVQVVLDTLGRLEPGSPSLLQTSVPGIAANVIKQMSEAQYLPARVSGRPVRAVRRFHIANPNSRRPC